MTNIEVKNYLSRYLQKKQEIKELDIQIAELKECADNITQKLSLVPGARGKNNSEIILDRALDLEQDRKIAAQDLVKIYDDTISAIRLIASDVKRNVLYYRYINYLSYETIAESEGYSVQYLRNTHSEALKELGQLLKVT